MFYVIVYPVSGPPKKFFFSTAHCANRYFYGEAADIKRGRNKRVVMTDADGELIKQKAE